MQYDSSRPIEKFSATWKAMFFTAAILVIVGGAFGFKWALEDMKPFKFVCEGYICVFGLLMAIVDMPDVISNAYVTDMKYTIFKYLLFMTRFTGRGIWYLFLGSMVLATLWRDRIFAIIFGFPVVVLGVTAIAFGVQKTRQLEAVRVALKMREQEDACNPDGMTKTEFSRLAIDVRGQTWDEEMMLYVLNALSLEIKADDHISREEFLNWIDEPLLALL